MFRLFLWFHIHVCTKMMLIHYKAITVCICASFFFIDIFYEKSISFQFLFNFPFRQAKKDSQKSLLMCLLTVLCCLPFFQVFDSWDFACFLRLKKIRPSAIQHSVFCVMSKGGFCHYKRHDIEVSLSGFSWRDDS